MNLEQSKAFQMTQLIDVLYVQRQTYFAVCHMEFLDAAL